MAFAPSSLNLSSADFRAGEQIPDRHAYESGNVSPALHWEGLPPGTRSVALFCHDPDAPMVAATGSYGFVHWLVYNIPPSVSSLAQGCRDYTQGGNDFGGTGYDGPRPPDGHGRHHYYFWLLALDLEPTLPGGLSLATFLERIEPHVLGMNRLVGHYEMG
jgi:Raf kinase inhibitor-like YbhB/YbcL family protein